MKQLGTIVMLATKPAPLMFGEVMVVEYIRYKLNEPGSESESAAGRFEMAYRAAASSLDASPHCLGYELSRCVEDQARYIVRIEWDSIEGHLAGFRHAPEFASFFAAIKPYIGQIEEMQHYTLTSVNSSKRS